MTSEKNPWERSPLEIKIIDCYEAQVVGEEGDFYNIEFHDYDMSIVEAEILKKEFKDWPHPIKEGTCFGIMIYKYNGELKVGSWPLKQFWSKELLEYYENQ